MSETNNVIDISSRRPVTVHLESYHDDKVLVIKVVKDEFGLGLAKAKDLVESGPCDVGTFASRPDAERLKRMLEEAGGLVSLSAGPCLSPHYYSKWTLSAAGVYFSK